LITISLYTSVHNYIPDVQYQTLLGNYIIGILAFAILGIVEFAIANYCESTYQDLKTKINELVKDI